MSDRRSCQSSYTLLKPRLFPKRRPCFELESSVFSWGTDYVWLRWLRWLCCCPPSLCITCRVRRGRAEGTAPSLHPQGIKATTPLVEPWLHQSNSASLHQGTRFHKQFSHPRSPAALKMQNEYFTQQLLRKLDVPLPRQETEPEPESSVFSFRRIRRHEIEAPIDIPRWLRRGKVLEFKKDRTFKFLDCEDDLKLRLDCHRRLVFHRSFPSWLPGGAEPAPWLSQMGR
jgi:hypothetical protein